MNEVHDLQRRGPLAILMERGKAAARAGKKAEARYFFEAVLERVPDHPDALLWLAYLAGGGRPSLACLARLLEADPSNQRARAAIRWARKRAGSQATTPVAPPPVRPSGRGYRGALAGLVMLLLVVGGLATAAFALGLPAATPTQAHLLRQAQGSAIAVASATAIPPATPSPEPSPTPTERPSPTASPSPSPSPSATPTATELPATPTATPAPIPLTPLRQAQDSATPSPFPTALPTAFPTAPIGDSFRWIDVDLTHQRLTAYEGQTPVRTTLVSTGLPRTPTVTGRFQIYVKYRATTMSGPGYYLTNVPYVMYFYRGYGLHGTYWHHNFGQPMSHGCVNLPTSEAEWLYNWASVGTLVVIHY